MLSSVCHSLFSFFHSFLLVVLFIVLGTSHCAVTPCRLFHVSSRPRSGSRSRTLDKLNFNSSRSAFRSRETHRVHTYARFSRVITKVSLRYRRIRQSPSRADARCYNLCELPNSRILMRKDIHVREVRR